jgi:hypothetical protein
MTKPRLVHTRTAVPPSAGLRLLPLIGTGLICFVAGLGAGAIAAMTVTDVPPLRRLVEGDEH